LNMREYLRVETSTAEAHQPLAVLDSEVSLAGFGGGGSWSCGWTDLPPAADMSSERPTSSVVRLNRSTDLKCPSMGANQAVFTAFSGDHDQGEANRAVLRLTHHTCRVRDVLTDSLPASAERRTPFDTAPTDHGKCGTTPRSPDRQ